MKIDEQKETYSRFMKGTKWAMVGVAVVLVLMAAFLL